MTHPLALFRYCPRCGADGFADHDARSRRCPSCGFVYYHNASAATVAVVLNVRGEVLVTRRAFEPARGTLDLPGGFVDAGESIDAGCRREVCEETGLRAVALRYLFSLPNTYLYSGFTVHTADAFFLVRLEEGTPRAADDAAELMWLSLDALRPADFGLDSIRRGVERLQEMLRSGELRGGWE